MKYLETNLTKYVQVLLTKNYKILLRETKENLKKQRDKPCSWVGSLCIVKMSILPKLVYRFNTTLIKFSARFFYRYQQDYSKIYMEVQRN